jgi:hypothetical protein
VTLAQRVRQHLLWVPKSDRRAEHAVADGPPDGGRRAVRTALRIAREIEEQSPGLLGPPTRRCPRLAGSRDIPGCGAREAAGESRTRKGGPAEAAAEKNGARQAPERERRSAPSPGPRRLAMSNVVCERTGRVTYAPVVDSVLAVPVPEADPVVRDIRARLDSSAALGVPAHVTVLYPFLPPEAIDATVLHRLAELFAQTDSFSYEFVETRWFGEDVLWLAPADDTGFRGLTHLVQDTYPNYPAYKAAFAEVTPHLTIGHGHELAMLEEAARQVSNRLPIRGQARAVHLLVEQADGLYQQRATFSLRRAASLGHPEL